MKEISDTDNLAIAGKYPGQALEVVPARYSRMTRPTTWPANCAVNSDCDDGIWCNGAFSLFWTLSLFEVHAGIHSFALMNINLTFYKLYIIQVMRRAAMWACANLVIGRAPMDYCVLTTYATN